MNKKLLVIDDQEGVAKVIARVASELGYESKALTSPEQAAEVFLSFRPDVVMLDMIMPEKDGIDVLNEIMLTGHRARIVLTSGLSNAFLRLAAEVARFHDRPNVSTLRKPFRRNELIAVLKNSCAARELASDYVDCEPAL